MFDAFKMLGNVPFLVFILCSTAICVPLAYYFAYTSVYLPQIGFQAPASTMALGQMSEIVFMLLVPFFFRKTRGEGHDFDRNASLGGSVRSVCVRSA